MEDEAISLGSKPRCQSCGMPLGEENYGTERDGTTAHSYCSLCYESGEFVEPELTLEGMLERSINHMTTELGMTEDEADHLAHAVIPNLLRWRD